MKMQLSRELDPLGGRSLNSVPEAGHLLGEHRITPGRHIDLKKNFLAEAPRDNSPTVGMTQTSKILMPRPV